MPLPSQSLKLPLQRTRATFLTPPLRKEANSEPLADGLWHSSQHASHPHARPVAQRYQCDRSPLHRAACSLVFDSAAIGQGDDYRSPDRVRAIPVYGGVIGSHGGQRDSGQSQAQRQSD